MVDQLNEDAGPGYTSWSSRADGGVTTMYPKGYMAKMFAKFFATKTNEKIRKAGGIDNLEGDVIVNPDSPMKTRAVSWSYNRGLPFIPEVEINRRRRYEEYEKMDDYPEVTAALDIYADDSTQKDLRCDRWIIKSDSLDAVDEIKKLFKRIRLDRFYWDIVRGTCKYGDTFIETIANANDMESGLYRLKILNPYFILRIEDEFGRLQTYLQEIPTSEQHDTYMTGIQDKNSKYIELDKHQIVHFRLHTSDPKYYPYGKSILAGAIRVFRSLKLMEDAMLVYRLSRAPERRIFYIDVGNLPANRAEAFLESIKARFKKERYYANTKVDARHNPLAPDEDYYVPIRGNQGTKIETLPGAQNLGEVDDVKYFRDKLLATLKIPKDYMVEFDKSPERKANLSQLDVKFARVIKRIQDSVAVGFETVAKRHLKMKGFPATVINNLVIELPDPSDMFTKRKLEIDEAKARVVQAVLGTGLFPRKQIYREYYNLTDAEIERLESELEKDMEKEQQNMMQQGMQQQAAMGSPITPGMGDIGGPPAQLGLPAGDQPANPPEPTIPKKESLEYLSTLKHHYLMEYGVESPQYKAVNRLLENKN